VTGALPSVHSRSAGVRVRCRSPAGAIPGLAARFPAAPRDDFESLCWPRHVSRDGDCVTLGALCRSGSCFILTSRRWSSCSMRAIRPRTCSRFGTAGTAR
jgi:Fe-S-cluster containining protein